MKFNLPFIDKIQKKEERREFFLAFLLKPESVGAILFEEKNKNLVILSTKEEKTHKPTEEMLEEELIQAADRVISFIEESLSEQESVTKTIFAVPHFWVEDGHIKKDHLLKLKKVCEDLELTPMGFIVSAEAIISNLQVKQGAPLTAIFVEVAQEQVSAYIVRAGSIIETYSGEMVDSTPKTVELLLKHVKEMDVLPSKIILFSHDKSDALQQEFLSFHWTKSLPFLHVPQVTILEKGFENDAIIHGVAGQMGFDVFKDLPTHVAAQEDGKSAKHDAESVADVAAPVMAEEFGFVREKDIIEEGEEDQQSSEREEPVTSVSTTSLEKVAGDERAGKSMGNISAIFGVVRNKVFKLRKGKGLKMPMFLLNLIPRGSGVLLLIVLAGLIGCIYLYYAYILRADVIIFADRKVLTKDVAIVFSSKSRTSSKESIIQMEATDQQVDGEKEQNTTGKKDTGDKAKGEITIYNKTDQKKAFSKDTIVIGTNNLEFRLLDDVNVASTSAFSTTLSSSKVKVDAAKFGTEYNLPSETNFTFKDFPSASYFAKNESAFSGGTKKSVQVVSKKDLDSLSLQIVDELTKKALSNTASKLGPNEILIQTPLDYMFDKKSFNKKENEEAKQVKLTATVTFKIGAYKKSEIESFAKELTRSDVPEHYKYFPSESKLEVKDVKIGSDGNVAGTLRASVIYVPDISENSIISDIKGKGILDAQKRLKSIPGASDSKIILKNKLPVLPVLLPSNPKDITITIKNG